MTRPAGSGTPLGGAASRPRKLASAPAAAHRNGKSGESSCIVLAVEEASAATARSFVAATIRSWGLHVDEDVTLLTSEAVTNSVEHADTANVVLTVRHVGGRARVEVQDDDPALPVRMPPDPWRAGGMGVALIQWLSKAWGVEEILGDGKRLWFEVEL